MYSYSMLLYTFSVLYNFVRVKGYIFIEQKNKEKPVSIRLLNLYLCIRYNNV